VMMAFGTRAPPAYDSRAPTPPISVAVSSISTIQTQRGVPAEGCELVVACELAGEGVRLSLIASYLPDHATVWIIRELRTASGGHRVPFLFAHSHSAYWTTRRSGEALPKTLLSTSDKRGEPHPWPRLTTVPQRTARTVRHRYVDCRQRKPSLMGWLREE
jgi:hypothetical protein